jgi:hypothetical protein
VTDLRTRREARHRQDQRFGTDVFEEDEEDEEDDEENSVMAKSVLCGCRT